jgi:hypothetical protein
MRQLQKKLLISSALFLKRLPKDQLGDLISLIDLIKKFGDEIPQSVKDCLDGNA